MRSMRTGDELQRAARAYAKVKERGGWKENKAWMRLRSAAIKFTIAQILDLVLIRY